jgi:uncharacterized protein (DUF433 family)
MPTVDVHAITKTPGVCGGDACIRGHRIPVWVLVNSRRQGNSDSDILRSYPQLSELDLRAAWDYQISHVEEIEGAIKENEESLKDNEAARAVEALQLPEEKLAALAKTHKPPQWWYEKDESLF